VLPHGLADTPGVMRWIATELSAEVYVSIMDQYFPTYRAVEDPVLGRKITEAEYEAALDAFEAAGLYNGWLQDHECVEGASR
jgi:putative pyruvate formate lyase activating enzyme